MFDAIDAACLEMIGLCKRCRDLLPDDFWRVIAAGDVRSEHIYHDLSQHTLILRA
jgi:hypothetical protein